MPGKVRILKEMLTGRTMRVAVLGAKGAGKTTFIVSLCQLLRNSSQSGAFNGWTQNVKPQLTQVRPYKPFPLANVLEAWKCNEWPESTVDVSLLCLPVSFHQNGKRAKDFELQILDIPGERVADFGMFGKNYREWSEFIQSHADGSLGRIKPLEQFFKMAQDIIEAEATKMANAGLQHVPASVKTDLFSGLMNELICQYKTALSKLDYEYSTFVSPSVVKLNEKGVLQNWDSCLLGLDAQRQFVPLPRVVWTKKENRTLVHVFEKAYDAYVARIVDPVVKWLARADKAIYLVDVLTLLNDGCGAYATQKAMGDAALSVFDRRARTAFGRSWDWLFDSHVDQIQLLATQADRVPTNQHENMKKLLDQMHGAKISVVDDASTHTGTVTAVLTTKQNAVGKQVILYGPFHSGDKKVSDPNRAIEFVDKEGAPIKTITVPDHWPNEVGNNGVPGREWEPGEYQFPFTMPTFPTHDNCKPNSREMDGVIKRLFAL